MQESRVNNYCYLKTEEQFLVQVVRHYQKNISYTIDVNRFNWSFEERDANIIQVIMRYANSVVRYKVKFDKKSGNYMVRKIVADGKNSWQTVKVEEVMRD